jgi:hypothetical protein
MSKRTGGAPTSAKSAPSDECQGRARRPASARGRAPRACRATSAKAHTREVKSPLRGSPCHLPSASLGRIRVQHSTSRAVVRLLVTEVFLQHAASVSAPSAERRDPKGSLRPAPLAPGACQVPQRGMPREGRRNLLCAVSSARATLLRNEQRATRPKLLETASPRLELMGGFFRGGGGIQGGTLARGHTCGSPLRLLVGALAYPKAFASFDQ